MNIDETRKLINAIKNDVLELMTIDYERVGEELGELDLEEKKELLVLVGSAVIEILAMMKIGPSGMVFSALLKLLK